MTGSVFGRQCCCGDTMGMERTQKSRTTVSTERYFWRRKISRRTSGGDRTPDLPITRQSRTAALCQSENTPATDLQYMYTIRRSVVPADQSSLCQFPLYYSVSSWVWFREVRAGQALCQRTDLC